MKSKIKIVINNKELSVEDNTISSDLLFTEDEIENLSTDLEQAAAQLRTMANKYKGKQWRIEPEYLEPYAYINDEGSICTREWTGAYHEDECRFRNGNCFPCRLFTGEQVWQIACQNELNSLLAQYAVLNGALASKEEVKDTSMTLYWIEHGNACIINGHPGIYPQTVLFSDMDVASKALEDVAEPFCRAHPKFVW